ncbi:hypothetical protein HY639_00210 [Candidatus Woesearchaeota archaeon]|nr:hypothetical protein [Candidatus Woesearchaeota archaeon]
MTLEQTIQRMKRKYCLERQEHDVRRALEAIINAYRVPNGYLNPYPSKPKLLDATLAQTIETASYYEGKPLFYIMLSIASQGKALGEGNVLLAVMRRRARAFAQPVVRKLIHSYEKHPSLNEVESVISITCRTDSQSDTGPEKLQLKQTREIALSLLQPEVVMLAYKHKHDEQFIEDVCRTAWMYGGYGPHVLDAARGYRS